MELSSSSLISARPSHPLPPTPLQCRIAVSSVPRVLYGLSRETAGKHVEEDLPVAPWPLPSPQDASTSLAGCLCQGTELFSEMWCHSPGRGGRRRRHSAILPLTCPSLLPLCDYRGEQGGEAGTGGFQGPGTGLPQHLPQHRRGGGVELFPSLPADACAH